VNRGCFASFAAQVLFTVSGLYLHGRNVGRRLFVCGQAAANGNGLANKATPDGFKGRKRREGLRGRVRLGVEKGHVVEIEPILKRRFAGMGGSWCSMKSGIPLGNKGNGPRSA
jgi:hypothetical protein